MTVFEDDYLMGYKPRKTALLSHRDVYIPAQLFTIRGAKAKALGQVNIFLIFEVYVIITSIS